MSSADPQYVTDTTQHEVEESIGSSDAFNHDFFPFDLQVIAYNEYSPHKEAIKKGVFLTNQLVNLDRAANLCLNTHNERYYAAEYSIKTPEGLMATAHVFRMHEKRDVFLMELCIQLTLLKLVGKEVFGMKWGVGCGGMIPDTWVVPVQPGFASNLDHLLIPMITGDPENATDEITDSNLLLQFDKFILEPSIAKNTGCLLPRAVLSSEVLRVCSDIGTEDETALALSE